jgi:hypothetical protein
VPAGPVPVMHCHFCQRPGAPNHCGKCNVVFYCNRDCQVADWKNHKKFCNVVTKQQPPTPGMFTMTKTPKGTQISFGYQAKQFTLAARDEFEAAVAAVEALGIEPPPLVEAGVTSIKMAITALNVPFIATLWLQETQYGPDASPEIRRVQELATKITGAPHLFHVLMQMAGDRLAPSLSCKSADISDQDVAVRFLTDKYSAKTPVGDASMNWACVGVSLFLYLLEKTCGLDMQLLRDTQQFQDRAQKEPEWDGKSEEMASLQTRMEASQLYSAGQDLYELLTELTRRSLFDHTLPLKYHDIEGYLSGTLTNPVTLASTEDKSIAVITSALRAAAFSSHRVISSIHVPAGTTSTDALPYYCLNSAKETAVQFSTLMTWNTCHPKIGGDGYHILSVPDECPLETDGNILGELPIDSRLVETLYSSAFLNAHLLMCR